MQKLRTYIDEKNAKIKSQKFLPTMKVQCEFNHEFSITYKNWNRKWC